MKPSSESWIEIAKDGDGWHWQLWSANGQAMARNPVAYGEKKHAIQAAQAAAKAMGAAKLMLHGSEE